MRPLFVCVALFVVHVSGHDGGCGHDEAQAQVTVMEIEAIGSAAKTSTPPVFDTLYRTEYMCPDLDYSTTSHSLTTRPCQPSYTCTAADVLSTAQENFIKNDIMPVALAYWADILKVNHVEIAVYRSAFTCCNAEITPRANAAADYFMDIFFSPIGGTTPAYAVGCQTISNHRPVRGYINFAPASITTNFDKVLAIAIHEIGHLMGFTRGNPAFQALKVTSGGRSALVGPSITAALQDHFGCEQSDLTQPGAWVEGDGTGSHFEQQHFMEEFMVRTIVQNQKKFTALAPAVLKDMAVWADVDASGSSLTTAMGWGQNRGCDFLTDTCTDAAGYDGYLCSGTPSSCSNPEAFACTASRESLALCLSEPSGTPGCGNMYREFTNGAAEFPEERCNDATVSGGLDDVNNAALHNENGRCFSSTATLVGGTPDRYPVCNSSPRTVNCHERICSVVGGETQYTVSIGVTSVLCPPAGGSVDLGTATSNVYTGTLECPPAWEMCGCAADADCVDASRPCSTGTCSNNICNWNGERCSRTTISCPSTTSADTSVSTEGAITYEFTVASTSVVTASTCNLANFATKLTLFDTSFATVSSDDDGAGCGDTSLLIVTVPAGTYYLTVGSESGETGTFTLNLGCATPTPDTRSVFTHTLTLGANANIYMTGGTQPSIHSSWVRFKSDSTAGDMGTIEIDAEGNSRFFVDLYDAGGSLTSTQVIDITLAGQMSINSGTLISPSATTTIMCSCTINGGACASDSMPGGFVTNGKFGVASVNSGIFQMSVNDAGSQLVGYDACTTPSSHIGSTNGAADACTLAEGASPSCGGQSASGTITAIDHNSYMCACMPP